jgi:hypothetical protein
LLQGGRREEVQQLRRATADTCADHRVRPHSRHWHVSYFLTPRVRSFGALCTGILDRACSFVVCKLDLCCLEFFTGPWRPPGQNGSSLHRVIKETAFPPKNVLCCVHSSAPQFDRSPHQGPLRHYEDAHRSTAYTSHLGQYVPFLEPNRRFGLSWTSATSN